MPRIRSVHPGITTDEDLLECSIPARLFFILLGTEADDAGCFEWKPLRLKMRVFPADHIDVEPLLAELVASNRVIHYTVDGKHFGAIRNFTFFQRPKKPVYRCARSNAKMFPSGDMVDINDYIGLTKKGTELDAVKGTTSTEPKSVEPHTSTEPEAVTGGQKWVVGQHREEGGDNREEIREEITTTYQSHSREPAPDDPPEPGGGFEEKGGDAEPDPAEPMPDENLAIGDVTDLPAPKPREPWAILGEDLLAMTGLDRKPKPVATGIVRQWLADWSEEDIRAAVSDAVERETYDAAAVGNLKYFEPAIRRRIEAKAAEIDRDIADRCALISPTAWVKVADTWKAGKFLWDRNVLGPQPDEDGFLGPDEARGPKHPQPIKQPANTEHQEARTA